VDAAFRDVQTRHTAGYWVTYTPASNGKNALHSTPPFWPRNCTLHSAD